LSTYLMTDTATQAPSLDRARIALEEQLKLASELQHRLLPPIPREALNYRWCASMVPAYEVGGDFYDFLQVSDYSVLVMVGDISGKGIPAALMQSALKVLFRVHAASTTDPAELAARMSAELLEETGGLPYATAILARLDRAPARLTFANAGHPPGFLVRDGEPIALASTGMPLGLWADTRYEAVSVDLFPDDLGVFVTDGITEALEGTAFSLRDALRRAARSGVEEPSDLCAYLQRVAAMSPGPPGAGDWQDDRTSLSFRVLHPR
jgi:sigma-B regulation protein RsbU (phosphoserine phosphatase)